MQIRSYVPFRVDMSRHNGALRFSVPRSLNPDQNVSFKVQLYKEIG